MSRINTNLPQFTAEAYHNGEFKTVSTKDVLGKWSIFMFYPADFTFV
ncbi:MAG: redoxin domain-containing protein, partial [Candidatus Cloacimonetes bacterium]|nr:redoxin domain-containing protein [Candidatus Cloacimonadota bacterium]